MGNSNSSEVRTRDLSSSEVTTGNSLVETLDPSVVMAAENAPITTREVLKLASLGINHQFMTSRYVTMESEKYICVRETLPRNNVVIIDMRKPTQPLRKSSTADSALMNPVTPIIALKGEIQGTTRDNLQIFNIETKTEVKSYQMPERVVFWKWITPKMLGLVTRATVYHWSIEGDSKPMKIFDRTAYLANNQIINYMCDTTEKWFVLIGIAYDPSEGPQFVKGSMQIFSVDERRSQALEAHAASFATFTVEGSEDPLTLICIASKIKIAGQVTSKLRVIELGAQPGKPGFYTKKVDMLFPPNCQDDFPMAMQVSQKYGLIYVITMMGLLFVYDLETAQSIYSNRISSDPIFLITEATTSGGFYAINRKGHVLLANVNDATIVPFVSQLNKEKLAMTLAIRANLPGAENLFTQRFEELLRQTKYKEAAELAAESPHGILRTPAIFAKLKSGTVRAGQLLYFGTLITKVKLNAFESLELCRLVLKENRKDLLEHWLDEDKLECTKVLGDLVKTVDTDMARMIHERSNLDGANNLTEVAESSSHVVKFTNFSLTEINKSTNNFDESLKIGIGGSGIVYKGFLRYTIVAIKKLHPNSSQTDRLFHKEVDILTKVKHPNLVNLIGASLEARALVYEFLPNGSLDDFLTNRNSSSQTLSWQIRIRVACEICSALIFLHSVKPHGIAHGDLKPANVLLDSNFVTKLSDFGISRELTTTNETMSWVHKTEIANGTLWYIDPEYIQTCELTPQSDVYSFGIMLLQFVTGKDPPGIRMKVEKLMNIRRLNELVDNSAGWPTDMADELASLGLECCDSERKKRPGLVEKVWPSLESMKSIADYS